MHYYQFNIGDYAGHTRNLSLMEDLAYRRLLDLYYLSEHPISGSSTDVAREIGMRDHVDAVEYILGKYFEQTDDGWRNKRADVEIAHFVSKRQQASNAGKASAQRRLNGRSTDVGLSSTDVQPNNNQEPITNKQDKRETRKRTPPPEMPEGVDQQTWADWLTLRSKKNAPVTQTVIRSAIKEAEKAGMHLEQFLQIWCARGSTGLEASWLKDSERKAARSNAPMSFAERDRENNIRRWEEMTGRTHPERGQQLRTIDIGGENVLAIESN